MRSTASNVQSVPGAHESLGVRLSLLGGFRAEHAGVVPESAWQQRQSAKMLVKLMATHPSHSLHREQVLELLWPEVEFASAVNSFGKALHVARRALEPNMPNRGTSSYLRLTDDVLSLVTERIWIDADHFQKVAEEALSHGDVSTFERALALYSGELLPEDTYETWTASRRDALADLHLRLLIGFADALERRGDRDIAIERLAQVLQLDPAREDVHRRLMRLHAEGGRRHLALRQYQLCCDMLKQELDAQPESETVALYEEIRTGQIQQATATTRTVHRPLESRALPATVERLSPVPLFGRDRELNLLLEDLASAESGGGMTVMLSGEVGVGKTRLVAEVARQAAQRGALVVWGASHGQEGLLPYGPFAEALETYMATCDLDERELHAARYPELVGLVPSLGLALGDRPAGSPETEQSQLFAAIARMLTDLAAKRVVVLVLDDLHAASWETLQLVQYLAHLAGQRRWLIFGTFREEDLAPGSELQRMLTSVTRQGLCRHANLPRLARHDCDKLVHALTETGAPSSSLLEHIHGVSLGNPLFATELVGAMQGRGELVLAHGYWHAASPTVNSVPRQVERLVDVRFERMEDRAQRVLSLVAIAGDELSFDELCLAAYEVVDPEISEATLLDILDAALQSNMLEERNAGYAFTHPLVRATVSEQLSRRRRAQLHGALARAIEAYRPREAEAVAYHVSRSAEQERAAVHAVRTGNSTLHLEREESRAS